MVGLSAVLASTLLAGDPVNGGPLGFPQQWLEGSPFTDYLVPGLFLGGVIGTGMMGAAISQLLNLNIAPSLSFFCGLFLDAWIGVQVTIIPLTVMQPVFFAIGTWIAFLSLQQLRRSTPAAGSDAQQIKVLPAR